MQNKLFHRRTSYRSLAAILLSWMVLFLWAPPSALARVDSAARQPAGITLSSSSIAENQPVNTVVGALSSTDPGDTVTYSLVVDEAACPRGENNDSFHISGDELRSSTSFNFELKNSYLVCIRATDQGGSFFTKPFTITVEDANDAPVAREMVLTGIPGMSIPFTLTGSDEDGDSLTFSILSSPEVGSLTGTAPHLTYTIETCALGSFYFTFKVNDGFVDSEPAIVTIVLTAINQPPLNITLSNASVNEHQSVGTVVGDFSTTAIVDICNSPNFIYSFCGGADDGSFSIDGATLKTAAVFDYEVKNSYNICVRSTNSNSLFFNKNFTIAVNNVYGDFPLFNDVPHSYWAWRYIEAIYAAGITGGCGPGPIYCPTAPVTRAQMAVFLLRGIHGGSYTPPEASGTVFNDVPANYWAAAWIEQLAAEGITGGCGGGNYCPEYSITRDQMAVFLLRAKYGSSYVPLSASGTVFSDVPADYWAGAWIEQLAAEGITGGCGAGIYCPLMAVTRDQMAVFLQRVFNLPLPGRCPR